MQQLRAILFTDDRPGHIKQSKGVLQALGKYVDLTVDSVTVARRPVLWELYSHVSYGLRLDRSPCFGQKADLVLGTGSRTHIPVLSCARAINAKALCCMAPMSLLCRFFDLYFAPFHDQCSPSDNLFETIGPPNLAIVGQDHDQTKGLILVGGLDPHSHIWDEEKLMQHIRELLTSNDITDWTISSSPRTPAQTEQRLEALVTEFPAAKFFPFGETASGWVEQQYQRNKTVWITADSISMVYEALSAGCSVGILPLQWRQKTSKFQFSQNYLIEKGFVVSFEQRLAVANRPLAQKPLNEADRCAREILRRWWPKSLQ